MLPKWLANMEVAARVKDLAIEDRPTKSTTTAAQQGVQRTAGQPGLLQLNLSENKFVLSLGYSASRRYRKPLGGKASEKIV